MQTTLILASTSRYRKPLLEKHAQPFLCASPEIDETPLPGDPAEALGSRLPHAKGSPISRPHDQE